MDEIGKGNIVINPFEQSLLNTNSYDVCIGNWYVRQRVPPRDKLWLRYNNRESAREMWAEPVYSDTIIPVLSGETIMCHTLEVIGGQLDVTTEMRAKSTTARFGLSVCKCAGLGDVGFISRWTMEITNHSEWNILIPVGEPIAQILFHKLGRVGSQYSERGARYGQGDWTPQDMLPKGKR
jgi:dCTP deaminase